MMIPKYLQQEFFGPQGNNLADPSPGLSWSLEPYFNLDVFSFNFVLPNPPNYPICL